MNKIVIEEIQSQEVRIEVGENQHAKEESHIGTAIKYYREKRGRRGTDLAKEAGVDPRTLAAIESGRIRNPSIRNIQLIAKALGVSTAEFFSKTDLESSENAYLGSQKGEFYVDVPERGYRLISYIPATPDFFIGKVVMNGGAQIDWNEWRAGGRLFLQVIFGKLTLNVCERVYRLKEGSHFLLSGYIPHTLHNEAPRECSFLLMSTPSFLTGGFQR